MNIIQTIPDYAELYYLPINSLNILIHSDIFKQLLINSFKSNQMFVLLKLQEEYMRKLFTFGVLLTAILLFGIAEAEQTKLVVRAKSKDAKFIGTSMGGASVIIRDSENGKVLADGTTSGATGNTKMIMIEPRQRGVRISDSYTAKFETVLDIDEPRLLTIEVEAPNIQKPDTLKSSTQVWLIPGKDITGDGVIIEVPGFSISTNVPETLKSVGNKATIPIQARIVMI